MATVNKAATYYEECLVCSVVMASSGPGHTGRWECTVTGRGVISPLSEQGAASIGALRHALQNVGKLRVFIETSFIVYK